MLRELHRGHTPDGFGGPNVNRVLEKRFGSNVLERDKLCQRVDEGKNEHMNCKSEAYN